MFTALHNIAKISNITNSLLFKIHIVIHTVIVYLFY